MGKRDRWDSSSDEDEKLDDKKRVELLSTTSQSKPIANLSTKKLDAQQPTPTSHLLSRPLHNPLLHGCRKVYDCYEQVSKVSEGTFGIVWKARDLATEEIVALKEIKFNTRETSAETTGTITTSTSLANRSQGFPVTALREISVLLALSHESIVDVKEMVVGDSVDKVYMVMEFMEFDLKEGLSKFDGALFQGELKGIMRQILSATEYMHSKWYMHRDLKTSNILVHRLGRIALADFGLARRYQDPPQALTQLVVTLWYRAPELLFGEAHYTTKIDMWSIGCIFGELICKDSVLQGQGELDQIDQIFALVGAPNDISWPSFQSLPNAGMIRWKPKPSAERLLPKKFPIAAPVSNNQAFLDPHGYDLLVQLLTLDPSQRMNAKDALQHKYFTTGVPPKTPRFFSSS